ncbi:hypothetical protein D0U04_17680 [Bacillus clarus]|uniref:YycH family protein n=1 Tax=Bacillus clarus TaxID=2338372 RepID=A0A090Z1W6_9BACI|nr:two-component system activity regulator YycH [Bacillus clarus]KFN04140.1 yycH family protein [Bacillus clarus]RFT65729.1 hypothetical protein D0U04_17680 [Bacillus clarus]
MNMENFKTIVLINLVVISLFLTFNLWTYVPDSTSMQNTKFVQGNEGATPIKISDVVLPSSVIVHKDKNHFVSETKTNIDLIYNILEGGELHDFKEITSTIAKGDFLSYVHGEGKIEIVFPTNIPLDSIKSMLNIKDKNMDKDRSFNRIILDPSRSRDQEIKVNFVSYDNTRRVYQMTLNGVNLKEVINAQNQFVALARPYFEYTINDTKKIFLPDGPTELSDIYYVTSNLGIDTFKNALFSDPRYLNPISDKSKEIFTDGIRSMEVDKWNTMLKYKNSSVYSDRFMDNSMLLQKSFEFVSGHSGFMDLYRFDYIGKGKSSFRLYEGGLPVFNKEGLAELKQVWGAEEVIQYERPLFELISRQFLDTKRTLPTGHKVIQSLENNPTIDKKLIQDIGIGYKLEPGNGPDGKVAAVTLQPIWYVKYGENQQIFEWSEEMEGELNGLGSN